MFSFSRKARAQHKESWNQAKYEYEEAIRRCYQSNSVTLALCAFRRFLAFNFTYSNEEERKPFAEADFKLRGVVHEVGQFSKHIRCEVEILPARVFEGYIGECVLTHESMPGDKTPPEGKELQLDVTLRDPTGMLRTSLIDGLRDAALSGLRFMYLQLECPEATNGEFEKALSDMRAKGYASKRGILAIKMWPTIELRNAPGWARRED